MSAPFTSASEPLAPTAERQSDSAGADLFKRVIWIPITAALGFVAVNLVRGGSGAPHLLSITGAALCLPALVLAWLWASYAWGRLFDWRLGTSGALAVGGIACLLGAVLGHYIELPLRSYSIGLRPQDVVFTPHAMWVSDPGGDTVYRMANKGGIRSIPVHGAFEVIADRDGVWVSAPDSVTQLQPDGAVGITVPVPGLPGDMVVAGRYLWLTLPDTGRVARIDTRSASVTLLTIGGEPASLAFAGGVVWVTDVASNRLFGLDAITGEVLRKVETGSSPYGVFTDGRTLWVANTGSNTVTEVNLRDYTRRDFRVPAAPTDLVVYHGTVWVLSQQDHALTAVDDATSEIRREIDLGGEPIKLEVHDASLLITNPGLGLIQQVPLSLQSSS